MKIPGATAIATMALCTGVLLLTAGCGKPPVAPGSREPSVTITAAGLDSGNDTLYTDSLSAVLNGDLATSEFRYRINNSGWLTTFSKDPQVLIRFLDDGYHTLEVQTRYEGWVKTHTATLGFVVAALDTTALYLYPYKYEAASSGDSARFSLRCRGLPASDRMHLVFSGGTVASVKPGKGLDSTDLVLFVADSTVDIMMRPHGRVLRDTMEILELTVHPVAGADTTWFVFNTTQSVVRDTLNAPIAVAQMRGGVIVR